MRRLPFWKHSKPYCRVKPGDTLSHISLHTGISVAEIKRLNNIKGSLVLVGQKLQLRPYIENSYLLSASNKLARISHQSERFRNKAFQPEDVVFYFEG
ncbi:LysM peptidoglycan-binding domain-containing protein [Thermodesulfobacteriota bacterium]